MLAKRSLHGDPSGCLTRSLHVQQLQGPTEGSLVAINAFEIPSNFSNLPYPYRCPGPEHSPFLVRAFYSAGLYLLKLKTIKFIQTFF